MYNSEVGPHITDSVRVCMLREQHDKTQFELDCKQGGLALAEKLAGTADLTTEYLEQEQKQLIQEIAPLAEQLGHIEAKCHEVQLLRHKLLQSQGAINFLKTEAGTHYASQQATLTQEQDETQLKLQAAQQQLEALLPSKHCFAASKGKLQLLLELGARQTPECLSDSVIQIRLHVQVPKGELPPAKTKQTSTARTAKRSSNASTSKRSSTVGGKSSSKVEPSEDTTACKSGYVIQKHEFHCPHFARILNLEVQLRSSTNIDRERFEISFYNSPDCFKPDLREKMDKLGSEEYVVKHAIRDEKAQNTKGKHASDTRELFLVATSLNDTSKLARAFDKKRAKEERLRRLPAQYRDVTSRIDSGLLKAPG